LVVTSHVGEGHLAAARTLAADLEAECEGVEVAVVDAFAILGPVMRFVLLDAYRWQLGRAPWLFGSLYASFARVGALQLMGRRCLVLFGRRRMLRHVRSYRPHVVVSTYPATTMVLGYLRERGKLAVPVYATITDLGGVEFWAHPGIDLHLVMHAKCIGPVEAVAGLGSACQVRPMVDAAFFEPRSRGAARQALRLPTEAPLVVVSGGGWGVGDIEGAVRTVLRFPKAYVVCLAGRNAKLESQLRSAFWGVDRVSVCGFLDEMSDLLAAADALVHSTGGVTVLEAAVRRCPVIAYGFPAGHLGAVTREMVTLGAVDHASSGDELLAVLARLIEDPPTRNAVLEPAPSAASLVLTADRRAGESKRPATSRTEAPRWTADAHRSP
jgi:UDP-N-acetylglucosamine:LPS N-acetylglucosamine transferase